jgi:membrane associated rhomboid family serine protease
MSYGFRTGGWGRPSPRGFGFGGFGWMITPAVKKLIFANAAVFLATALLGAWSPPLQGRFVQLAGLVPRDFLFALHLWQPFTYLFLHGGFWHLFWNMFGLWMFGAALERDWGQRRFLRYYFLTGVGAGLLSVALSLVWGPPATQMVTIGASGAIYGILLAFGLLYPHTPIYLWFLFPIPARVFVLIYGVLAFLSALSGPGSGVAHVAHLGGMLFGYAYLRGDGLYYRLLRLTRNWQVRQARSKFDVYMGQKEDPRTRPRPDRWVN